MGVVGCNFVEKTLQVDVSPEFGWEKVVGQEKGVGVRFKVRKQCE